jgi:outer membrane protein assembly factor BamB
LEQRDERECVTAYDLMTGELKWLVDHEALHYNALGGGGPRSTPTIEGTKVYAQGATGTVWCLDLLTGEVNWLVDLLVLGGWDQDTSEESITWGRSGSPLLVDGLCVVPMGGGSDSKARSLVALDGETGEVRWTAGDDQISYASAQLLTLDGVRQIVSVNEATITGHAIEDGILLWETDWEGSTNGGANCAAVVPAGEDRFLIGKGYGGGSALIRVQQEEDGWKASDVWRLTRVLKTKFNHSVILDGVAYGLSNGALQAVEVESGERLWEQGRRGRYGQGQLIAAGDVLIVQAEMGEVALVEANPNEFNEWIRIDALNQKTWNVPSLSGNILLVRNGEEAIAFELPSKD